MADRKLRFRRGFKLFSRIEGIIERLPYKLTKNRTVMVDTSVDFRSFKAGMQCALDLDRRIPGFLKITEIANADGIIDPS